MNQENKIPVKENNTFFGSVLFSFFLNYFRPSNYINSIFDIDLNKLVEKGIKFIVCDLDNTLVPHFTKFPTKNSIKFVEEVKQKQLGFLLLSNNTKKRVEFFSYKLNVDNSIHNAKKPFSFKLSKFLQENNILKDEVVVIGDTIITDILMSNILRIESILVKPIVDSDHNNSNFIINFLEKRLFKRLSRDNFININKSIDKKYNYVEKYEIL